LIASAIEFHICGLIADGDPIPQPATFVEVVEVADISPEGVLSNKHKDRRRARAAARLKRAAR
jgi:hypothetical protein